MIRLIAFVIPIFDLYLYPHSLPCDFIIPLKKDVEGTSLAVQWLRLRADTAGGMDSIPDWGTKIFF